MKNSIFKSVSNIILKRPGLIGLIIAIIIMISIWLVSNLEINHNQLDLIPQDLPSVKAIKKVDKLMGGVSYFLIGLKSDRLDHMKGVADDFNEIFSKMPEIREVSYKKDVEFIRKHFPYYIKTEDLQEGFKRFRKILRKAIRKESRISLNPEKHKDDLVKFDDLIKKYQNYNKKNINDPYNLDPSGKMLLMIIKPAGSPDDMNFTEKFLKKIKNAIAEYNLNNKRGAKLKEYYKGLAPDSTVTYGFTGDYINNFENSENIKKALAPTSIFAFLGIFIYLFIFLRRFSQVILIMSVLVSSVIMSFAFCKITVGELNTITALLGAILMGFGIDFGIHFIHRFREEYTHSLDFESSIRETVIHSGEASMITAMTSSSALFVLLFSEFKGFAHFGLIAGAGILISVIMMYTALPVIYILIDKKFPGFKKSLINTKKKEDRKSISSKPYPYAKLILITSLALTVIFGFIASGIKFDYNTLAFMVTEDNSSVILQNEIHKKFSIPSDPVGVYTETLEDTKALYEKLSALPKDTTIQSVISIFSLAPDMKQQNANREIMDRMQERLDMITPDMLSKKDIKKLKLAEGYLKARPFTLKDVPKHLTEEFILRSEKGIVGYITYIYPGVFIWDGKELIRFAEEVGAIKVNGKVYCAAGAGLISADLAKMVISDGKRAIILSTIGILFILFVSFRKIKAVAIAMLPLVAGIIWMLGLMTLTDWKINYINIVVFPVVFGYGISTGIHLYHRFLESDSVMLAIRQTGVAIAGSSITTFIAWSALLLANHPGLKSMGILACFGIAADLIVSFTIMPALVQIDQDYGKSKAEKISGMSSPK